MNILIVDDNRLLCKFLQSYLKGRGHNANFLIEPKDAVEWLDNNPSCDSLIMDIGMPKIDGITLVGEIREKRSKVDSAVNLAIVMFTGLGYDEEAMAEANKAGSNGYVSKGLGPSEIYSALIRVRHRLADKIATPTL